MYNWFVRDALISRAPWGELGAGPSHRKRGLGKASSGVPGLLRSTPKQRARWHEGARESLGESLERGTGLSDRSAGPASREAGGGPRMAEQFRACLGEVAGVSLSLCLSRVAVRLDPAVRALAGSLRGQPGRGVDRLGPLLEVCTPVAPPSLPALLQVSTQHAGQSAPTASLCGVLGKQPGLLTWWNSSRALVLNPVLTGPNFVTGDVSSVWRHFSVAMAGVGL